MRMFQKCIKTVVFYQAINEIVAGVLCLSYAGFMMVNVPKMYTQRLYHNDTYFYHFLLWVALSSVLKGFLLLIAAIRTNRALIVVYIIWTTVALFLGKAFVVRAALQMRKEMEQTNISSSTLQHYRRSFAFYFYVFYPLIFVVAWFFHSLVVLYFVSVVRRVEAKAEDIRLENAKNDIEVIE